MNDPQKSTAAELQRTDPEEWARRLDEFVDSLPKGMPVLSDEAMSRESIYEDRGLTTSQSKD